jgi:hypothetical protein
MEAAGVQEKRIWRIEAGQGRWTDDELAVEEPLEIRVGTDGRVIYPESAAAYGLRYSASARTVRSWVETGKAASDLPPLATPAA